MAKITSTEIGEAIMEKIKENGRCQIPGLGVFSVKQVGERTFRNPRDQQSVVVPAHKALKFKQASNVVIA